MCTKRRAEGVGMHDRCSVCGRCTGLGPVDRKEKRLVGKHVRETTPVGGRRQPGWQRGRLAGQIARIIGRKTQSCCQVEMEKARAGRGGRRQDGSPP